MIFINPLLSGGVVRGLVAYMPFSTLRDIAVLKSRCGAGSRVYRCCRHANVAVYIDSDCDLEPVNCIKRLHRHDVGSFAGPEEVYSFPYNLWSFGAASEFDKFSTCLISQHAGQALSHFAPSRANCQPPPHIERGWSFLGCQLCSFGGRCWFVGQGRYDCDPTKFITDEESAAQFSSVNHRCCAINSMPVPGIRACNASGTDPTKRKNEAVNITCIYIYNMFIRSGVWMYALCIDGFQKTTPLTL